MQHDCYICGQITTLVDEVGESLCFDCGGMTLQDSKEWGELNELCD